MIKQSVLVFSSNEGFCQSIRDALHDEERVVFSDAPDEILDLMEANRPGLVILPPEWGEPGDRDPLRLLQLRFPEVPVAFLTATDDVKCYQYFRMYGVGAAIPCSGQVLPGLMRCFLQHLEHPLGLVEAYVRPEAGSFEVSAVRDIEKRGEVLELIQSDFEKRGLADGRDVHLVYEEIVNNAFFHAFGAVRGERRERVLPEGQALEVSWFASPTFAGFQVTDRKGKLNRVEVWERFIRQVSLEGLLDTAGRGLYLAHLLTRMLLITVIPGRETRVAAFFAPGESATARPISVQVVPPFVTSLSK